jgi:hypothetical protein
MFEPLYALRWHRLRVHLRCRHAAQAREHPLAIFDAVFRCAADRFGGQRAGTPLFRRLTPTGDTIEKARVYPPAILFPVGPPQAAADFAGHLAAYLQHPAANFELVGPPEAQERCLARLEQETPELAVCTGEICLRFLTPLAFRAADPQRPAHLTAAMLLAGLRRRIEHLWPLALNWPAVGEDLQAVTHYWGYERMIHRSKSSRGHGQFLNGCVGPVFLLGNILPWLPVLRLGQETNVAGLHGDGQRAAFGMGAYDLCRRPAAFDGPLVPGEPGCVSASSAPRISSRTLAATCA